MSSEEEKRDLSYGFGGNGGPTLNHKKGWVAVSRAMRDHWLVGFKQMPVKPADPSQGTMSRAEAWIDLIMECRFEAGAVMNGGRKMSILPGQLLGAVSWLAHRWNWTPWTVRVWLDKLEEDGMIDRSTPGVSNENHKQTGKQSAVITVSNYSDYQVVDEAFIAPTSQANRTQTASRPHADRNIDKDNTGTLEQGSNPPSPLAGGAHAQIDIEEVIRQTSEAAEARATKQLADLYAALGGKPLPETIETDTDKSKRAKQAAADRAKRKLQEQEAIMAVEAYNRVAEASGFHQCDKITASRMTRLIKRLEEIGGLEPFERALAAIPIDRFLSGQLAGKNGDGPFRLSIDRLCQTDGGLGDVLVGLLEKSKALTDGKASMTSPDGKTHWGWWIGLESKLRGKPVNDWRTAIATHKPNGQWPWWIFGPPPGSPDCLVPAELIAEFGFDKKYKGQLQSGKAS